MSQTANSQIGIQDNKDASQSLLAAIQAMAAQMKPVTQLPDTIPIAAGSSDNSNTQIAKNSNSTAVSPAQLVTQAIANSGQLIPQTQSQSNNNNANEGVLSQILNDLNSKSSKNSTSTTPGGVIGGISSLASGASNVVSGVSSIGDAISNAGDLASAVSGITDATSGFGDAASVLSTAGDVAEATGDVAGATAAASAGGDILASIGTAIASLVAWIICTELMKQDRLPKRWWIVGAKVFANYPERVKNGYYVWAVPAVRHLRLHPHSLFSRFLELIFNWRAENIAANAGIKNARKLWRGAAVTIILWPICYCIGCCVGKIDWSIVYKDTKNV